MSEVLILDSGLFLNVGHHLGYSASVKQAFEELGYRTSIYSSRSCTAQEVLNISTPSFSSGLYERYPYAGIASKLAVHVEEIRAILLKSKRNKKQIIFFPNASILDILAFQVDPSLLDKCSSIHLMLRFAQNSNLFTDIADSNRIFINSILESLNKCTTLNFYSDTSALFQHWLTQGIRTIIAPIPIDPGISYNPPSRKKKYQISCLGQASIQKGLVRHLELLLGLNELGKLKHSFMQTTFMSLDQGLQNKLSVVEFNNTPLSSGHYHSILSNTLIYPNLYDRDAYLTGSSNALLEAIISGCIPLCSDYPFAHEVLSTSFNFFGVNPAENPLSKVLELLEHVVDDPSGIEEILKPLADRIRLRHSPNALARLVIDVDSGEQT